MKPFAEKQCASCHKPHSSEIEHLLKAPIKPLCLSCHRKIAKYYFSANQHRPFELGSCDSCHRAHASEIESLLQSNPRTLCLGCHRQIAKLMKLPVKMEPFEEGGCPKCHNPHASPNEKLLRRPLPELCFDCHEKIAEFRRKPVQMAPFRQGLCLGCHRPHASQDAKLLRGPLERNELCYRCHEDIRENYEPIGHNRTITNASAYQPEGGVGSCLNCHEPHGSDFGGLIQKESISLCLSCHGPRSYFSHPFGLKWTDPWNGGYLRCTSCHNPMGSGIDRLKRADRDGLCIGCHRSGDPSYIFSERWPRHGYKIPGSF
jgi:predicted CXXCH cytochrome family protein